MFRKLNVSTTNLRMFSTSICVSPRANLGNQRFPVALHCTHLRFFGRAKQGARGRHRAHSSSPAPPGLEWDRTPVPGALPGPPALTGTKVMPGAFPACLQPLQHHQTTLWVLQEVQRQQQTCLNWRTPHLHFPVFIAASLLHHQLGYIAF